MAYYGQEFNGKDVYYPEGFNIDMINQEPRFLVYQQAFNEMSVVNKVVCDLGAGTGLLGLEALRQGATHVYLVEMTPESLTPLRAIVDTHPLKDKITIIDKDICSLNVADFMHTVDVFVSETFGSMLWNEGAVVYFNHVLDMFPDANILPEKIVSNFYVATSDFSDSLLWPQVGDPNIVNGYKELYNSKRFQLNHTSGYKLYANKVLGDTTMSWQKNLYINTCNFNIDNKVEDVWVAAICSIQYSSTISQNWCCMGWYFKSLENCSVSILIENDINPVIRITNY